MVDKARLAQDLQSIEGQVVGRPVRSHGSMFIVDFGKLSQQPGEDRAHGDWCFLFEQAKWTLRTKRDFVTWIDDPARIDYLFDQLHLAQVKNAIWTGENKNQLKLEFSNGTILLAEANSDPELRAEDQWIFFTPSGRIWTAKYKGVELEQG